MCLMVSCLGTLVVHSILVFDVQRKNWLRAHDENVMLLAQRDADENKLGMLCGECGIPIQKSGMLRYYLLYFRHRDCTGMCL